MLLFLLKCIYLDLILVSTVKCLQTDIVKVFLTKTSCTPKMEIFFMILKIVELLLGIFF